MTERLMAVMTVVLALWGYVLRVSITKKKSRG